MKTAEKEMRYLDMHSEQEILYLPDDPTRLIRFCSKSSNNSCLRCWHENDSGGDPS